MSYILYIFILFFYYFAYVINPVVRTLQTQLHCPQIHDMADVTAASEILYRLFFFHYLRYHKKGFKLKSLILARSTFYVIYYTVCRTSIVSETRDVASFEFRVKCSIGNKNFIFPT
jgi:hypothetical protein